VENETNDKEMYQQPLSFKHQALVDLTLAKSPKDTREKDLKEQDKDRQKELQDKDFRKEIQDKTNDKDVIKEVRDNIPSFFN